MEKLHDHNLDSRTLLIDGSFWPKNLKDCGCCGPPPSQDYKIEFLDAQDSRLSEKKLTRVDSKLPVFVDARLYDAARVAGQDFIVFLDEGTDGSYKPYALVI